MPDDEKALKRIAGEYLHEYGARLREEMDSLDEGGAEPAAPGLDRRLRRAIGAERRARSMRYAGLAAACLILALSASLLLRTPPGGSPSSSQSAGGPSSQEGPSSSQSAGGPSSQQGPSSSQSASPGPGLQQDGASYETLALSFDLPPRFSVASVEQDIEKTIYSLQDSMLDDVILTMERGGDISRYLTLAELSISGRQAYGSSDGGYSLLAFLDEDSDILYVLTCRHDVNTLLALSRTILI